MATERSLERCGVDAFDLLLLHNPDRTGYTSEAVWDAMAARARRRADRAQLGVAPGPANGFTLDLIDCFERFGERIDWAMVILNPLEPWPGELVLDAAARHDVRADHARRRLRRAVLGRRAARPRVPALRPPRASARRAGSSAGGSGWSAMRPIAERHGLTMLQLACQWNLAHAAVHCVAPTLIQEAGRRRAADRGQARRARRRPRRGRAHAPMRSRRSARSATTPARWRSRAPRPSTRATPQPDRWSITAELTAVAGRWGIDPQRTLAKTS